jgi:tetratricopeptide (TPR) repeat protein
MNFLLVKKLSSTGGVQILAASCCLLCIFFHSGFVAADVVSSTNLAKIEFVKAVPLTKGAQKLLESSGDRLYFSTSENSVAVTDSEGKLLHTLRAKEGADPVLKRPEAVAVGEGVIYVADSELNQIVMFSTEGEFKGSFGAEKSSFFSLGSSGEHELKKPLGVVHNEGIVFVLDSGSRRILMFGSNGVYIGPLEIRANTSAKATKAQADVYKLSDPVELKIDRAGCLYVLDADDSLVKVYSPKGEFLHAIPKNGELSGIAVAQDGVYVAKNNEYKIQKYDFNDKLMYEFGAKGDEPSQFRSLSGMAMVKDRQIVIADSVKGTMSIFIVEAGVPLETIPKLATPVFVQSKGASIAAGVTKLAWNGKDTLYGIDAEQNAIAVIRNGKLEKLIKLADITPVAIALEANGILWVLDKKKYRVVKLDIANGKVMSGFGREGSGDGQFVVPTDLQVSVSGNIYVADRVQDSVQIFDYEGRFIRAVRKLNSPVSIAIDEQENLYVLENANNTISIHSAQGGVIGYLGKEKSGAPGSLLKPAALMVTAEEVFVLDGNRVKVYSHKGEFLRAFGAKGEREGELDNPVAIVQKDDTSFFIAERSNKRIQTFETQYKPIAPLHFLAVNGLHSIELNWDYLPLSFVKQYQIYRSKDEHSGFVRAGTSSTNKYIDRGLEANGKYFYRVAAETRSGFEGATSTMASGISKSYTPPVLDAIDVTATPSQIKMTWKPIESDFVNSYYIYVKEGNTFTKIGEAITPEYTKDMLTPNTRYTFYVAAHSTDGTEAEKFEVKASTLLISKPPLEMEVLDFRPIFTNSYKLYEKDGVGTVKLTNNTDKDMDEVTLSFLLKDFMDVPTETKPEKLPSGKSIEIKFTAVFNNHLPKLTEDATVQATLEAGYSDSGKRETYSKNITARVYELHKLLWSDPARYASFITPQDPPLISFIHSVVTLYPESNDEILLAAAVFNALGVYGITYVQNPNDTYQANSANTNKVDSVQFPRETLERKSGDSVDLVALYAAAIESLGISTRVIKLPYHLLMMFSTGIKAEADGYSMDEKYVVYEGMLWIPVDATLVGDSFIKAWEAGAAKYYKWKRGGLDILDVSRTWQTYPPATLPETKFVPFALRRESIDTKFSEQNKTLFKIIALTKMRHYRHVINNEPKEADAHLQIGIIFAKLGNRVDAMKYFDKVLDLQPGNAAALNNRGNLFMLDKRFADAKAAYSNAAKAGSVDPYIWINLAKAYKATKEIKAAKAAFAKAQKLDSSIKQKYKLLFPDESK